MPALKQRFLPSPISYPPLSSGYSLSRQNALDGQIELTYILHAEK
jgi:hypothetical protein